MATVAELDAQWEAAYLEYQRIEREYKAALVETANSAAYKNAQTDAERNVVSANAPANALRLELNAQGQTLNSINKELEAAKAAEKQAAVESDKTTPVVDKPAPVPPEGGGDANTAPTAENPAPTQQTVAQDDKPTKSATTTQKETNAQGNTNSLEFIKPEPNILDNFASNTWAASVYLLSPAQYTELMRTQKKNVNGYNLLFQSGGAPVNTGGFQGASNTAYQAKTTAEGGTQSTPPGGVSRGQAPDAGRNPAFTQDFYIDNISFDNALPGKQTQTSHMISNLKFTVTEPANITLLDRLYAAVQDMAQTTNAKSKKVNYTAAQYLMVIRWYGYDVNGNLVAGKKAADKNGLSDTNAIVEKFIPFLIRKINWGVSNKLVSYEFDCAPVGQIVGGGTRRGTIPYDVQLSAQTVEGLLGGPVIYSKDAAPANNPGASTTAPGGAAKRGANTAQQERQANNSSSSYTGAAPKANAAAKPKPKLDSGLAAAMTIFASDLVTVEKVYTQADVYEVIFADNADEIKNATIVLPGSIITQASTPMGVSASDNANQALSGQKNPMDIKARNYSITAGMQMSQVIDLAIRNSSYIYNQSLTVYDSETNKEIPNPVMLGKPVSWFNVTMQAVPLEYDEARNDYSYKITYIISKYEIPNFESNYFPVGKFRGIHKRYPYWFTGENTAVLDYTASFNAAYNMTISGGPGQESADAKLKKRQTSNGRDIVKYTYAARSDQSNKGADGVGNEIGANAAEYLYAYADPGGTKLKIIGDPAWIQQGSLAGGVTSADLSPKAFLPDGTINFDNSQVLFEIAWQRPEDYDLSTGLANPYARTGLTPGQPVQSNFYQATKINNEFRGGKFEQTIIGVLYLQALPDAKKPDGSAAATAAKNADGSASTAQTQDDSVNRAEDAKFARQGNRSSATASGSAVVTPQIPAVQSAMNQLSASFDTGTLTAPVFSSPNFLQSAISGTTFTFPQSASVVAPTGYPRAPTGSGVAPVSFANAPLPLNTTLENVRQRIQNIVKDN